MTLAKKRREAEEQRQRLFSISVSLLLCVGFFRETQLRTKPRRSERPKQRQRRQPLSPLLTLPIRQPRNPFPPTEILTPDQIQQLHDASMHILENVGYSERTSIITKPSMLK